MIFEHPDRHIPKNGGVFMRKIIWTLLLCLVVMPLHANDYGLSVTSDCETINSTFDMSNQTWSTVCDEVLISGDAICSSEVAATGEVLKSTPSVSVSENDNGNCWCKMTAPYEGEYWVSTGYATFGDEYGTAQYRCEQNDFVRESCVWRCSHLWNQAKLYYNQEMMYYGYYTDEGLIAYKTALFADGPPEIPCEIGISKLMVSTGDSFQLYAEQYTEHALVVQYKDQRCYLKLEEGKGGLNIMANDTIYHVVE